MRAVPGEQQQPHVAVAQDDVAFATMTYVDWFNQRRLHGGITTDASYVTPAEHEAAHYREDRQATEPVAQ